MSVRHWMAGPFRRTIPARAVASLLLVLLLPVAPACQPGPAVSPTAAPSKPAESKPAPAKPAEAAKAATSPSPAASPAAAAAAPAPAQGLTRIQVSTAGSSLLWIHAYLAGFMGYYQQEGLDAEIIETGGGPQALQTVMSGNALLGDLPVGNLIDGVQRDLPIVAVAGTIDQNANTVVVSKQWAEQRGLTPQMPLDERIKGLKDARIGIIGPKSATDDFARFFLLNAGLNPDRDVQLVALNASPNFPPALEQGQIDAFVGASPPAEVSIVRGAGISLVNGMSGEVPGLRGQLFGAAVVRRDALEGKREQVAATVRALTRAVKLLNQSPDEAKRVVREQKFSQLDPQVWELAWANNLPGFAKSPVMTEQGFNLNYEVLKKARGGEAGAEVPFTRAVDNSLAEAAVRAIMP